MANGDIDIKLNFSDGNAAEALQNFSNELNKNEKELRQNQKALNDLSKTASLAAIERVTVDKNYYAQADVLRKKNFDAELSAVKKGSAEYIAIRKKFAIEEIDILEEKYRKAAQLAGKAFDKEKEFANLRAKAATGGGDAVGKLGESANGLNALLSQFGGGLSALAIANLGLSAIKAADSFELMQKGLQRVSGGDAQVARDKFAELSQVANELGLKNKDLVETYVQLANRGFKPTSTQIKALIDISAVSRKTVTQLSEAILDAQTLEFERLKEFGIRQKDLGDKVQFTYAGTTLVADKTADSIAKTILRFGELSTIQGAGAAAAQNLTAAQNRLSNATDALLVNIGQLGNEAGAAVVGGFANLAQSLNDVLFPAKALDKAFDEQRATVVKLDNDLPKLVARYQTLQKQKKDNKQAQAELNVVTEQIAQIVPRATEGFGKYTDGLRINLKALNEYTAGQKKAFQDIAIFDAAQTRAELTRVEIRLKKLAQDKEDVKSNKGNILGKRTQLGIDTQLNKINTEYIALKAQEGQLSNRNIQIQNDLLAISKGEAIAVKASTEATKDNTKAKSELSKEEQKRLEQLRKDALGDVDKLRLEAAKANVKNISQTNEELVTNERDLQLRLLKEEQKALESKIKQAGLKVNVTKEFADKELALLDEFDIKIRKARQQDLFIQFDIEPILKAIKDKANLIDFSDFKIASNKSLVTAILNPNEFEKQFKELTKITEEEVDKLNNEIKKLVGNTSGNLDAIIDPLLRFKLKFQKALGIDDEQFAAITDTFSNLANSFKGFYESQNEVAAKSQEDLAKRLDKRIELQSKALDKELERQKDGSANNVEAVTAEIAVLEQKRTEALARADAERAKSQKIQLIADGISQVSNLITAGSEIIKGFSKIPIVGTILGIAAVGSMLLGFATLKNKAQASVPKLRKGRDPNEGYEAKGATHEQGGILAEIEDGEFVMSTKQSKQHAPFLRKMLKGEFDGVNLESVMRNAALATSLNDTRFALMESKQFEQKNMMRDIIREQTNALLEQEKITGVGDKLVKIKSTKNGTRTEIVKI